MIWNYFIFQLEFLLPIAKTNMILSLNHSERWGLPILNPNGCATTWIVLKVNTVVFNLLLTQGCLITNNKLSWFTHSTDRPESPLCCWRFPITPSEAREIKWIEGLNINWIWRLLDQSLLQIENHSQTLSI